MQEPGTKILYTTDGSIPSYVHGIEYFQGILVPKDSITFTFKAICWKPKKFDSELIVRHYKVDKYAKMVQNESVAI